MESSRRDLLNDMTQYRFIWKNNKNKCYPRFRSPSPPKGIVLPKTGVSFLLCCTTKINHSTTKVANNKLGVSCLASISLRTNRIHVQYTNLGNLQCEDQSLLHRNIAFARRICVVCLDSLLWECERYWYVTRYLGTRSQHFVVERPPVDISYRITPHTRHLLSPSRRIGVAITIPQPLPQGRPPT